MYSPVVSEGVYTSAGRMASGSSSSGSRSPASVIRTSLKFRTSPWTVTFSSVTGPVTPGATIRSPATVMSRRYAPSAALIITVPSASAS